MTLHIFSAPTQRTFALKQEKGSKLESWSNKNGLYLNREKTTAMKFSTKRKIMESSPLIRLDGKSIHSLEVTKFLGIKIDSAMNWDSHVESVCAKVASACYLIGRMMKLVNIDTVKLIYFGLIQSHLQYGVIVWGNSSQAKRLLVLQKRALRYMARASFNPCAEVFYKDSCRDLFIKFRMLTLPSLYMYHTIMYCIENNYLSRTNETIHDHNTRFKTDVRTESHRLSIYTKDPIYNGSKLFNALPGSIKCLPLPKIKGQLKEYFITNCFYSINEFYSS